MLEPEDYSDLVEEDEEELSPREIRKLEFEDTKRVLQKLALLVPSMTDVEREEYARMLDDAERVACELSLAVFFRSAWPHMDTAAYNHNWHFDIISDEVEKLIEGTERRLMVNMPPRCGKSLLLTVAFMVWTWIQPERGPLSGPQVKFITASYAQSLSFEHSNLARKLMRTPWFIKHWGSRFKFLDDRDAIGYYENDKGGYRLSTSVGSGITGRGADCVAEGTLVRTPSGLRPVESLQVGDRVLGFDHSQGEVLTSVVLATSSREDHDWYEICTSAGLRFECTGNHPVFIPGRGYVPAQELRAGDRVVGFRQAKSSGQSSLREMWETDAKDALRFQKDFEARARRRVLREGVFGSAPRGEERGNLPEMRGTEKQGFLVLLGCLQKRRAGGTQEEKGKSERKKLSSLGESIFQPCGYLLFVRMRRCSSFAAYGGSVKFKVQRAWEILKSISGYDSFHQNARRQPMRGLRGGERQDFLESSFDKEEASKIVSACAPHRREYTQQQTGEPSDSLRELPQKAPSRDVDAVASIRRHSGKKKRFYDIQVERFRNFFANDILVHNCIIIDDPSDTAAIASEAERTAVINWYRQSLSNRFNSPKTGAMLLVMQRQAVDDLSGYFLDNEYELWRHIVFRMRYEREPYLDYDPRSEEGELLWPERIPAEEVDKQEKITGSFGFAGLYQQRPAPQGGGLLKPEHWKLFPPEGQEEDWKRDGVICWPPFAFVVASVDLAYTEKQENDYSALTMWGLWHDKTGSPRIVVIHAWQDRLSFNPLVMRIGNNCRKFKPDVLLIESKASGISAAQEIRRMFGSGEWSTVLVNPKGDKVNRVVSVQGLFEEGLIYGPDREWCQTLIDQAAVFPKGKHDDLVDSMTQALIWMRENGLITRKEEHKRQVFDSLPRTGQAFEDAPPYDV